MKPNRKKAGSTIAIKENTAFNPSRKKVFFVAPVSLYEQRGCDRSGSFSVTIGNTYLLLSCRYAIINEDFEALDLIMSSIEERFDQPSFKADSNMESLLIGFLSSLDVSSQVDYMKENYADDVRTGYLFSQLEILEVLIKDAQINCFADVLLKAVKSLTDHERHMITEVSINLP